MGANSIGINRRRVMQRMKGSPQSAAGTRRYRYVSKDGKRHTRWRWIRVKEQIAPANKAQILRLGRGYGLEIIDL